MTRARDQIEQDLPFLVNGTLPDAERVEIEAWLADDAALAAERDALAAIRDSMQAEDVRSPGEFGLARLMRDIGREGGGPVTLNPVTEAPRRPWLWQVAAAAAVVALLAQTVFLREGTPTGGGYELAGASQTGDLVVGFVPQASEEAIRALLLDLGLEIVGGPSALGLYRLGVGEGGDPTAASTALRAAADVVESVENASD